MKRWKLGNDGFVMQYMIAGPVETDYCSDTTARDQMTLEGKLRHEIVSDMPEEWNETVGAGKRAENGGCWQVWAPYENAFVDTSKFSLRLISRPGSWMQRGCAGFRFRRRLLG